MTIGRIPSVEGGIQPTILDAKGDLIVATAADTPARLAVGSNGQYLKADSTTATGLAWATLPSSGKILQVVEGSTTTETSNSSSAFADTNLSASITPSSTSSKILILVAQTGVLKTDGAAANRVDIRLMRGATELIIARDMLYTNSTLRVNSANHPIVYLDSPSTTSSTTYKTQFANPANQSYIAVQNGATKSTIVLMEVGA
jgi:hypothetical protein